MDETQPLLRRFSRPEDGDSREAVLNGLLRFDSKGDEDNPMEWSNSYKWGVILLLAFMAFSVTFTCIGIVPIASQIVFDLEGEENKSTSVLLVTIWELGEAAGPLIIAPLSELWGRYPIYNIANIFFILWSVVAACSQSSTLFIFARFFTGCAVASNVLNPAIIGDILPPERRGTAMATLMLAPLLGGAIGPAIAGAITETIGWRNVLWGAALVTGVCELTFLTLLRETYKLRILKKKAARLRKDVEASSTMEEENTLLTIWTSIKRPATVFFGSLVLQLLSFYMAITFAFFYIMSTTFPVILREVYGFSPAMTGTSFMSFSLGSSFGIIVCNSFLDKIYVKMRDANNGKAKPEFRMPLVIISAFTLPAAIILMGWTAQNHWPVAILLISVGLLGHCLLIGMVPLVAYVVDATGLYSASALTAVLITRCLMGTFLPLVVPPLVDRLGWGYGFVVLAGVCLAVAPIPLVIMRYGEVWRQRSEYTNDN
ncbi:MFS general substrate transporter [Tothia fuscella]|uniref:MFS general substrate transporter n=1 Tax=Tothia fuscella TaxID=1048955 RepID=A0A9P4TS11_9PEZI|nr:MFS general substrate transporter [Tothia fuscella]